MRWLSFLWLALAFAACSQADGTRGQCAAGGALTACPEADRTAEGACWRLVDCGAIPLKADDPNRRFDWNDCVDGIQGMTDDRQRLVVDCIAASTCDAMKVDPNACFLLGEAP
jgi:hypothetical protein